MSERKNEDNLEVISDAARDVKVTELEILRQSLEEKRKQADEYYDQLLRLKAEFENYRRRTEKEKQVHLEWGKEKILLKQVGLLDVLRQAVKSVETNANVESIRRGLELISLEFSKMLTGEGVEEFGEKGEKFDPNRDEAVEHVESEDEESTIIEVLQRGYILNGRVIRPARVRVAKHKEEKK